jgi:ATP-binding cassette subfamily B (MDR/TAP) protein 1
LGGSFQKFFLGTYTVQDFHNHFTHLTLYFVYLAIGEFVTAFVATVGFIYTGEHATQKLRERFLGAILGQNMALFDNVGAGDITSTITADMDLVQTGMSEKVGLAVASVATLITALIVGFVKNWRLSLVLLSVVAAIFLIVPAYSIFIVKFSSRSLDAYAPAGTAAEEFFSSSGTVTAFNGQAQAAKKYNDHILNTMHWEFKSKVAVGCMIASVICVIYMCYGLSFWEGSRLLVSGKATLADTITVLMALMMAAVSLAHVAPHAKAFTGAVSAAGKIFTVIDRPPISSKKFSGRILKGFEGALEFRSVKHI